jgi:hypothetical protein
MKKCLFCSNPADSLEHVLPQWLFRCIAPRTTGAFPVNVGRYVEGQGYLDNRRFISLSLKARIVCENCNGGWMSKLESKVGQALKPLVADEFPILGHTFFEELKKHGPLMALWVSKTALTTSFALPGRKRPPKSFAESIAQQTPPPGVWVDVAKAKVPAIGAAFTQMFGIINGNAFVNAGTRPEGNCFQFCLQVNQLLLRFGLTPGAHVGYRIPPDPVPVRIYPNQKPVPENFEFDDLNHFCHSVLLRTWAGCKGDIPIPLTHAQT